MSWPCTRSSGRCRRSAGPYPAAMIPTSSSPPRWGHGRRDRREALAGGVSLTPPRRGRRPCGWPPLRPGWPHSPPRTAGSTPTPMRATSRPEPCISGMRWGPVYRAGRGDFRLAEAARYGADEPDAYAPRNCRGSLDRVPRDRPDERTANRQRRAGCRRRPVAAGVPAAVRWPTRACSCPPPGWADDGSLSRWLSRPQELLLAELGRACRVYPGLAEGLHQAQPVALELGADGAYHFLSVRPRRWTRRASGSFCPPGGTGAAS